MIELTKPYYNEQQLENIQQCLASGWLTQGPFVRQFESLFMQKQQANYALATTSCTTALHIAALALNLQPGDEILVPSFTWITTANTAEYVGATPVFVDVDPLTYNINPQAIENKITSRTKAILVVHLFGLAAAMDPIIEIANKYNLQIIEDAACAIGTTYHNKPVGTLGDIGCFSFHPQKLLLPGKAGW